MTRKQIHKDLTHKLAGLYPVQEADAIACICLQYAGGFDTLQYHLNIDKAPDHNELSTIEACTRRLLAYEPIQYITGHTWFYGFKFHVNPAVLIPRQETELLVDIIIKENLTKQPQQILDIGTGSGCIAISLAVQLSESNVTAIDISLEAIAVAKMNAELNKAHVEFNVSDILDENCIISQPYDIIVSNPPYVLRSEVVHMLNNVTEYEPHSALFVDDNNALCYYESILQKSRSCLKQKGCIYFEFNETKTLEMKALLSKYQFDNMQFYEDFQKKCRFVRVIKN
ncbi:MAG: peptide chain release factor N(5)-glutamine methyltransferase [Bacteroidales bacterium]|nr:peptide chain release factor N(5)-glutamine methyltransferase [Bacteroidales bacterium]HOY38195.1 peptide chain release factor N(5)-glutamine methyltransferase [Bacteroidales bacterium]HQP02998.1 peptide chain release factor N(5)-glutamine methyltransferase [Bacteroidales bacterium]